MNIWRLLPDGDRSIPPPLQAAPVNTLPGDAARDSRGHASAANDVDRLANAGWDGTDRRKNPERRNNDRRQQGMKNLLDTRTGSDRRHYGRRATDHPPMGRLFIKV